MNRIYLGANYYPEDWDERELDGDIAKMKECGFNVVRIGEFAWKKDEPEEGKIDLSWLHRVVDRMKEAGIGVIMGTPTATPPQWFYRKYPEAAMLNDKGIRRSHGGRRHCCSCNPDYLRHSRIIVEQIAREFGEDEGIVGWQIDNEIYVKSDECLCPHCMASFHRFLKEKYGTVEEMNRQWNLNLFSQAYDSFEDVPAPKNAWHNPHIQLDWILSQGKNHVDFVHFQARILKKYTKAPVGTDTMPLNGLNYRHLNAKMDVAQFNHYNRPDTIHGAAMWMEYLRHFSTVPFWNTETQACWNGSTEQGMALPPKNYIYFNTWLPMILGGGATLFWLWRTHWAGHELMHGAVLDTDGRYTYANEEIRRAGRDMRTAEPLLTSTRVASDSAILYTSLNWNLRKSQVINKWLISDDGRTGEVINFYGKLLSCGVHPDVIDAEEPLDSYKLLFAPCAFSLEEGDFHRRVKEWVQKGGILVAGPLTDIRTAIGTKYQDRPYGILEELTGAHLAFDLPHDDGRLTLINEAGEEAKGEKCFHLYDVGEGQTSLLTVTGDRESFLHKSAALLCPVGKGAVILLGTFPAEKDFAAIALRAASLAGAEVSCVDRGIVVTRRVAEDGTVSHIVCSMSEEGGSYRFEGRRRDLLTDRVWEGEISLGGFEVAVLVKE